MDPCIRRPIVTLRASGMVTSGPSDAGLARRRGCWRDDQFSVATEGGKQRVLRAARLHLFDERGGLIG